MAPTKEEELSSEILEFVNKKPTIYAGFGSMKKGQPEKLARIIIQACEDLGLQVVLSKGWGGLEIPAEYEQADFVKFVESVSHTKLFPKVKAIIHHGGVGTVHAALRAGTPSIIVPFIVDQPWWADRLHRLGLGPKSLPLRKFNKANLINRIKETEKYKDEVQNISQEMIKDDGVNVTLELVKKHLNNQEF